MLFGWLKKKKLLHRIEFKTRVQDDWKLKEAWEDYPMSDYDAIHSRLSDEGDIL